jgi:hypothetical protein
MSTNQNKNEEEVDLGSLFVIIGKGFSNFFNFIVTIFKGVFHFFNNCFNLSKKELYIHFNSSNNRFNCRFWFRDVPAKKIHIRDTVTN